MKVTANAQALNLYMSFGFKKILDKDDFPCYVFTIQS